MSSRRLILGLLLVNGFASAIHAASDFTGRDLDLQRKVQLGAGDWSSPHSGRFVPNGGGRQAAERIEAGVSADPNVSPPL